MGLEEGQKSRLDEVSTFQRGGLGLLCSFLLNSKCSQPSLEASIRPPRVPSPPSPQRSSSPSHLQREPGCQDPRASQGSAQHRHTVGVCLWGISTKFTQISGSPILLSLTPGLMWPFHGQEQPVPPEVMYASPCTARQSS